MRPCDNRLLKFSKKIRTAFSEKTDNNWLQSQVFIQLLLKNITGDERFPAISGRPHSGHLLTHDAS